MAKQKLTARAELMRAYRRFDEAGRRWWNTKGRAHKKAMCDIILAAKAIRRAQAKYAKTKHKGENA